jgi:hypothetical protein
MQLSILFLLPQVALIVALVENDVSTQPSLSSGSQDRNFGYTKMLENEKLKDLSDLLGVHGGSSRDSKFPVELIQRAVEAFNYETNSKDSKSTLDIIDSILNSLGIGGKTKDSTKKGLNGLTQGGGNNNANNNVPKSASEFISNALNGLGIRVNEGQISDAINSITNALRNGVNGASGGNNGENRGNGQNAQNAQSGSSRGSGISGLRDAIQSALSNLELNSGSYNSGGLLGGVFGLPNNPHTPYPQYTQTPQWNQPQYTQTPTWDQPQWSQTWVSAPAPYPSPTPYSYNQPNSYPNSYPGAPLPPWIDSGSHAAVQFQPAGYQAAPLSSQTWVSSPTYPSWSVANAAASTPSYNAYSGYSGGSPTQIGGWDSMDTVYATRPPARP